MNVKMLSLMFVVLLLGCSNTIKKTTFIETGMTSSEVREVMGNPKSKQAVNGETYLMYTLTVAPSVGAIVGCTLISPFVLGANFIRPPCNSEKVKYYIGLEEGLVTSFGEWSDRDTTTEKRIKVSVDN